jgi:imidazolonepropionase-like amidohydrolase
MSVAIAATRVYPGATAAPILDGALLLDEGGRVERAGGRADVAGAMDGVHDYPGCTVLPGLIDMHTHVLPRMRRRGVNREPASVAEQTVRGMASLLSGLRAGITTVRDAGAGGDEIFVLRRLIEQGVIDGPRIFSAGEAIAITGGHGWLDLATEADGADGVRQAVRSQLKAGADWIKLMATGGVLNDGEETDDVQMSAVEIAAAVEETHNKRRRVMAHVANSRAALICVRAGVDCVEHGIELDEEAVAAMAEHGTFLCPTFQPYRRMVRLGVPGGYAPFMVEKARRVIEPHLRSFRRAVDAGVRIVCGTDSSANFRPLGGIGSELVDLVDAGLTPAAAIAAATSTAAACLGDVSLGGLAPGQVGDVLVVEGNPFENIDDIGRVRAVYRMGRLVFDAQSLAGRSFGSSGRPFPSAVMQP